MTPTFSHLHVHSHYSTMDGMAAISDLVARAEELGMPAIALTDHGNMMGAVELLKACEKTSVKPIIGCEVFCTEKKWHLVLLAKNTMGYYNLVKIVSSGYHHMKGYKPIVDLATIEQYHEGLICLSGCIGGEVPQKILEAQKIKPVSVCGYMGKALLFQRAEEALLWYKRVFGEDYYVEIQRHETHRPGGDPKTFELQSQINPELIQLAHKHGIKVVATNDSHYVNESEADAHDAMLVRHYHLDANDPNRFRFTKQEWLKSEEEMAAIFSDMPEVLSCTQEVVNKIGYYNIKSKPLIPDFPKLELFDTPEAELDTLIIMGASKYYEDYEEELSPIRERLHREYDLIVSKGWTNYFLIAYDLVREARARDIQLSMGRGAAVGSLVCYCLGITQVDPIKYGLLSERFINDYIYFPLLDIDVEDCRRMELVEYLRKKYGTDCVAHVRTISHNLRDPREIRAVGVHACSIVLAPSALEDFVPMMTVIDRETKKPVWITQYSATDLQSVGMVRINILGYQRLSTLREQAEKLDMDLESIPLNDKSTLELFARGETDGVSLFELEELRVCLRRLHPDSFEELVFLNSTWRPGVLEQIDAYIRRKNGEEPVDYILPFLEDILGETKGLLIYQEQMMQIAKRVGGFSADSSDYLRCLLSRSSHPHLNDLHNQFMKGAEYNGYPLDKAEQIWQQYILPVRYTMNKSHMVASTMISYYEAYFRAHE